MEYKKCFYCGQKIYVKNKHNCPYPGKNMEVKFYPQLNFWIRHWNNKKQILPIIFYLLHPVWMRHLLLKIPKIQC